MYKIWNLKILASVFAAAALLTGSVRAEESATPDEHHVRDETRTLSRFDAIKLDEERLREEEKNKTEETISLPTVGKIKDLQYYKSYKYDGYYYYGAVHTVTQAFGDGSCLMTEDDTLWHTNYYDRHIVQNWYAGDVILIMPNTQWFSDHKFEMYNATLGTKVAVTLDPQHGPHVAKGREITMIDFGLNHLWLSDGTCWEVALWDRDMIKNWFPRDAVIIGINNKWDSNKHQYILIDYETDTYVRARLIY